MVIHSGDGHATQRSRSYTLLNTDLWLFVSQIVVFTRCVWWLGVGVLKGLLYAVGGHDGPLVRKSCEVYDPVSGTWKQVADMNMCRRNAGNLHVCSVTLY